MSQSLSRALTILGELGEGAKSLEQLATRLDVHKSTVLRLLRTMESERFVRRDAGHRYMLGSRLFELANRALEQRDVRTVARPHLSALNSSTGQTIHLATYESGEAVYIDKFDAIQSVRMYSRVGRPAPLHCTAVGKVLVAGRPDRNGGRSPSGSNTSSSPSAPSTRRSSTSRNWNWLRPRISPKTTRNTRAS